MNDAVYSPRAKRRAGTAVKCTKCHVVKPPYAFQMTKYATLASWCRDCKSLQSKEYYQQWMSKSARERN